MLILEPVKEARRTRSILLTSNVLRKRETIHVCFDFLILEKGGEDSGLHDVFEWIFQ